MALHFDARGCFYRRKLYPHNTTTQSPPASTLHPSNTAIMSTTEYVKVEKVIPKFPPPAFSDIAKASNDVCLGTHELWMLRLLTPGPAAYQQGLLPHCRRSGTFIELCAHPLTLLQLPLRSS